MAGEKTNPWNLTELPSDSDEYMTPPGSSSPDDKTPIADLLEKSGKDWATSFHKVLHKLKQHESEIGRVREVIGVGAEQSLLDAVMNLVVHGSSQRQEIDDLEKNFKLAVGLHDEKFERLGGTIAHLRASVTRWTERALRAEKDYSILNVKTTELEAKLQNKDSRNAWLQSCLNHEKEKVKEERARVVELTAILGGSSAE